MTQPARVLIVDDHSITRRGVRALLTDAAGIEVVAEAADGREAIELAEQLKPDVVLMDLVMPGMDGVTGIREILERQPAMAIVVLSGSALEDEILAAIRAGALGYLSKDASREEMVRAIGQVLVGEPALPPAITRRLMGHGAAAATILPETLSAREREVMRLVAAGHDNGSISNRLSVSEVTVRTHVRNTLAKLGLANRVELVLYALRHGWVSLDAG